VRAVQVLSSMSRKKGFPPMLRYVGPCDVSEKQIMELVNPRKVVDGRFASEDVEIDRILNTEEYGGSGCHYGVAFASDGRKFRVSLRTGCAGSPWTLMHEIKQFAGKSGKIDLESVVREFILSQYRDQEEINSEWVAEDLKRSESSSPIEGVRSRYAKFGEIYPQASKRIAKVAEEILIDLFCETDNESRMLVEEKGVFCWQTR
jgi:hypothetical protein